jgi:cellulase/cellobiase CelA1
MEKFDSLGKHELAEFKSFQEAVSAVEAGLAAGKAGVTKVYRIDVPGKEEAVFGVAITRGKGADKYIMDYIDFADVKSTAHLPYEILVSGNKVYHLFARFRIAISFPDLSMMGSNSFMSIMSAPGAIKESLTEAVTGGGKK